MLQTLRTLSDQFQSLEERILLSSQNSPLKSLSVSQGCRIISFANSFSFKVLSQRPDLITKVDDWYADGSLLCRTVGWGRGGPIPRYSFDFSSIAHEVFVHAQRNNVLVALLGGTEDEITAAHAYLECRYRNIKIIWKRSGYFQEVNTRLGRSEALADLVNSGAGIVIIGMGTPLQEEVALELKSKFEAQSNASHIIFTCGGFLTQTGRGGDYYPEIVKKTGLRWAYRAFRERHVRNRLVVDYPCFVAQVLAYRLYRIGAIRNHS